MSFRTTVLRTSLAISIAFAPALPAVARTSAPAAAATAARDASKIQIKNFGEVNANYYRGEQPEGRDYADLAAFGIRTIIDFQEDFDRDEARMAQAAGMKFYRIPMNTHRPPTANELAQFFKIVNDPANQPVYVHCKGGRHRTGVMTAAYRMSYDGWTAHQAFGEMKRFKFGADFLHPEFKTFVYGYDARRAALPAAAGAKAAGQQ